MSETGAFTGRFVGMSVERIEDLRLLRGRGQFLDYLHPEGMLHAVILRSSVAHGRVRSVDVSAARAMPGVRGIFTAGDIAKSSEGKVPNIPMRRPVLPGLKPFEQPVIAQIKVRYVGEALDFAAGGSDGPGERVSRDRGCVVGYCCYPGRNAPEYRRSNQFGHCQGRVYP